MKKGFYLTSPIFYPNAKLHMGHAYTMTVCDILARYQRLKGENVKFLTGSDENTGKVVKSASEAGVSVEDFLSNIVKGFESLYKDLNIQYDEFIKTTDKERHWPGVIEMWNRLNKSGDIYKSTYTGLYCPSCEAFYTEKELVDGKCPLHHIPLEKLEEENYFFRLSKYTDKIKEKIRSGEFLIIPETRRNEIMALLERGLEDISFSRPKHVVPHGIPVPGDDSQVIYVWCDALTSYITGVGFGRDVDGFKSWWPADVHVIGKDILRFHAAIWPAMLLSAGLPLPTGLLVHGFILSGGQKMSKSLGNVVDPQDLIRDYGADAVRYYLSRKISPFEDGDLTPESFKDAYNGDLANGLGNLVSRVLKMAETHLDGPVDEKQKYEIPESFHESLESFNIREAASIIWDKVGLLDQEIQEKEPFKLIKTDKAEALKEIKHLCLSLYPIADMLSPILPETSQKILSALRKNKLEESLFPRKN